MMKKLQICAFQKDLSSLSALIDTKASTEEVNESLQQKANKTSVANALQRKVNRADLDQLLEVKSDVADIENIITVLENKVENGSFEELARQVAEGP